MQNDEENIRQNTSEYSLSDIHIRKGYLVPAVELYCKRVVPEYSTHAHCLLTGGSNSCHLQAILCAIFWCALMD